MLNKKDSPFGEPSDCRHARFISSETGVLSLRRSDRTLGWHVDSRDVAPCLPLGKRVVPDLGIKKDRRPILCLQSEANSSHTACLFDYDACVSSPSCSSCCFTFPTYNNRNATTININAINRFVSNGITAPSNHPKWSITIPIES